MFWLSIVQILLLSTCVSAVERVCNATLLSQVDQKNRFWFPTPLCNHENYTGINSYPLGTKLTLRWTTTDSSVNLIIWQEHNPNPGQAQGTLQVNIPNGTDTYEFNGYPPQPLSVSNTFSFYIYRTGSTGWHFASDYFNITDPSVTTSSPPSSSTTLTSSTISMTSPTSAATSSATPVPHSSTSKNVGIGVGVGVACLVIIAVALAWFFMHRRKARRQQRQQYLDQQQLQVQQHQDGTYVSTTSSSYARDNPYHPTGAGTQHQLQGARIVTTDISEMEHSGDRYSFLPKRTDISK